MTVQALIDKLKEYPVGGLIYFEKNLESQAQITDVINTTKKYAADAGFTRRQHIPQHRQDDYSFGRYAYSCAKYAGR